MQEAKTSVFVDTFGNYPLLKVLDFFLMMPSFDYSKTQVAKQVTISKATMEKVWNRLVKNNIIIKTRTMGRAKLYQLNRENPKVKILMRTAFQLSLSYLEKEATEITHEPTVRDNMTVPA